MILIVDDKPENLFSLKSLLQLHGFETETAMSGEEALRKILKTDYEVIILDVQMPGMDGFEVAETIAGFSRSRDIPIVFLSAVNIDKRFVQKGFATGALDYITKPFDPDLLLLKVKAFKKISEQKNKLREIEKELRREIEIRKKAEELLEQKVEERTRELVSSNKDLELSNHELQQYAFLASHDLQEPLRKIQTFSKLVIDRHLADRPEAMDYMNRILQSSNRMRNLINDLLQHSRLSENIPHEKSSLQKILEEAIADLELIIEEKKAIIHISGLPEMEMAPGKMRQVFQNIISNSIKFARAEVPPEISIKGELVASLDYDSSPDPAGQFIRIIFTDNGIGFSDEYAERIFTLFQRLNPKTQYEGTGIGLSIVKKVIEQHHGIITARSELGKGSTFIIVLPLKQPS